MQAADFAANLHAHSHWSLLDGMGSPELLVQAAKEAGYQHLALTDHGTMFGMLPFVDACAEHELHGIVGVEAYYSIFGRAARPEKGEAKAFAEDDKTHLILLAADEDGYHNIIALCSAAYNEGFYGRPRIDEELLRAHSKGVIVLSGCLSGIIPRFIRSGKDDLVHRQIKTFLEVFGDRFYLEIQPHDDAEQVMVNKRLVELGKQYDIPLVLTLDSHYPCREDAAPHDALLCIQTGAKLADTDRMKFFSDEFWLRGPADVVALRTAQEIPAAVLNTSAIAERCTFQLERPVQMPIFPEVKLAGEAPSALLRRLVEKGWSRREARINEHQATTGLSWEVYRERAAHELETIEELHYVDYVLILADVVREAKERGIPVGPGRGSGAGSLVCWLAGITEVDPLRFKLSFERFIDKHRVDLPDLDLDFGSERHAEIIEYVRNLYGSDHVAHIANFQFLRGRQTVTDVGRVLGESFGDMKALSKLIPQSGRVKIDLENAKVLNPEFGIEIVKRPLLHELSLKLENSPKSVGLHAGGIIITPKPVIHYLPTFLTHADEADEDGDSGDDDDNKIVRESVKKLSVQADKDMIEGWLVKMDLLRVSALDTIATTIASIKRFAGEDVDPLRFPYDDAQVCRMLTAGQCEGVFQFESTLMKGILKGLRPQKLEDLALANAVARPGAMNYIPELVARRAGEESVNYYFPELEPILQETSGVIVYQEQLIEVVRALADYDFSEADAIRRACAKKKLKDMQKLKAPFIAKSVSLGRQTASMEEMWAIIVKFSEYAFNRSHSIAYAMIAQWTAYLKVYYPSHYFAALMTVHSSKKKKLAKYCYAAQEFGVQLLDLDINKSAIAFQHEPGPVPAVRFGFCGILGGAKTHAIIDRVRYGVDERALWGKYYSRVPTREQTMIIIEFKTEPDEMELLYFGDLLAAANGGGEYPLSKRDAWAAPPKWKDLGGRFALEAVRKAAEEALPEGSYQVWTKTTRGQA